MNLFGLLALGALGIQVHDEVLDVRERLFDEPFGDDPGDLAGETRGDSRSLRKKRLSAQAPVSGNDQTHKDCGDLRRGKEMIVAPSLFQVPPGPGQQVDHEGCEKGRQEVDVGYAGFGYPSWAEHADRDVGADVHSLCREGEEVSAKGGFECGWLCTHEGCRITLQRVRRQRCRRHSAGGKPRGAARQLARPQQRARPRRTKSDSAAQGLEAPRNFRRCCPRCRLSWSSGVRGWTQSGSRPRGIPARRKTLSARPRRRDGGSTSRLAQQVQNA